MKIEWLDKYGLSYDCRQKFLSGIERLKGIDVDVFLGNHCWNNDTIGKYERSLTEKENPFIDPDGWKAFLQQCEDEVKLLITENR